MEQFDSSVEESSKVTEQQQRNDEQQCPNCAAELAETFVIVNNSERLTADSRPGLIYMLYPAVRASSSRLWLVSMYVSVE